MAVANGNDAAPDAVAAPDLSKKRKRRESWGSVRKLPSGRVQASYTGPDGLRYTAPQTYSTMTLARAWLKQEYGRIEKDEWAPPKGRSEKSTPFAEYAEKVISMRTTRGGDALKPKTLEGYREIIRVPLKPFSAKPLAAITKHDVDKWYRAMIDRGVKTRASRAYRVLNMVMAQAVEERLIRENPCSVKGAAAARTGRTQRVPSRDEVTALAAAMPEGLRLAVLLAAYGGLRRGEVLGLTRDSFELLMLDSEAETPRMTYRVHVRQQVIDVEGVVQLGSTKTGDERAVLLPWHLESLVTEHLAARVPETDDGLVFASTRSGGLLPPASFTYRWFQARKAAKVDGVRFHDLRHFAGTDVTRAGGTVADAAAKLGHRSIRTAMIYQHDTGRQREISELIAAEARASEDRAAKAALRAAEAVEATTAASAEAVTGAGGDS